MKFRLERVSGPDIEPITLAEMKRALREFASDTTYDDDITQLIQSAREWVEDYTGRVLIEQTWRLTILAPEVVTVTNANSDTVTGPVYTGTVNYSTQGIFLERSPILAITSVVTVDADNVQTAVAASEYQLREADSKWPRVLGLTGSAETRITYRAGFADRTGSPTQGVEVIPTRFLQAMKLWGSAHWDMDKDMMERTIKAAELMVRPERANLQFG